MKEGEKGHIDTRMFGANDEYDKNKQRKQNRTKTDQGNDKGTVICVSGSGMSSGMDCRYLHSTDLTPKKINEGKMLKGKRNQKIKFQRN